ncbi:MAG: metallophosphoesterase [Synechococcaceae cyanobacterium]|nr:metallophosphoesterase [Synechococcaceae cyanobacterium]
MTPLSRPTRHWVIGDVHGCADTLLKLLRRLPAGDRLIFCGDVINRGPRIETAMELVWSLVQKGRAVWLRGNHEQALIEALRRGGLDDPALSGCDTYRQLGGRRCRAWLERLELLPLAYWGQGWVATHAGFDPLTWQPDLKVRLAFWQAYDGRFGDVVVGHTPGPGLRRLRHIVLIDTGACYGGPLTAYCPETGQILQAGGRTPEASPLEVPLSLAPGRRSLLACQA